MDEVLMCWCLALFIWFYANFLTWKKLEKFRDFAENHWLTWEKLLFLCLGLGWLRAVYDLIMIDYIKLSFLTSPDIEKNLHDAKEAGLTEEQINALHIPPWLKFVALITPIPGFLAFGIVLYTLVQLENEEEIKIDTSVIRSSIFGSRQARSLGTLRNPFLPRANMDVDDKQAAPPDEDPPSPPLHTVNAVLSPANSGVDDTHAAPPDKDPRPPPLHTVKAAPPTSSSASSRLRKSVTHMERVRRRSTLVNLVTVVPLVFVVMALRAEIRAIEIMTLPLGTNTSLTRGQNQTQDGDQSPASVFERRSTVILGTYSADLLLAAIGQYFTVYAFVRLCWKVFEETGIKLEDYIDFNYFKIRVGSTEFLSINMYIGLGFLNGLLNFVSIAVANKLSRHDAAAVYRVARFCQDTSAWLSPYRTFAAIVVFYSSQIMLRRDALRSRLANPPLQFKGTRWLLMADVQLQLLILMSHGGRNCAGAVVQLLLAAGLPSDPVSSVVDFIFTPFMNFGVYQAKLLHASLLSFECLVVVRFNLKQWLNTQQHHLLHEMPDA